MSSSAPEAAPATEAPAPAGSPCPRCGAHLEPGQEWCLECGAAARTRIAPASGWRAPVAIVAVVVALAGAAVAVGLVSLSDDASSDASSVTSASAPALATATTPSTSTLPPAATSTVPGAATTTTTPATSTAPSATTTTTPPVTNPPAKLPPATSTPTGPKLQKWPSGQSGFTVVLLSSTHASALAKARSLVAAGTGAGVLYSSNYPSLNPGYWVVFSGRYTTRGEANAAAEKIRGKVPEAYVRFVKPK